MGVWTPCNPASGPAHVTGIIKIKIEHKYVLYMFIVKKKFCGKRENSRLRSRDYKFFSCSTDMIMKVQLLIKTKMRKNKYFLAFILSNVAFIMLFNVKMPTTVGIIKFMTMINYMLS